MHLKELFPANTNDVDWMRKLAHDKDLVIVTADVQIAEITSFALQVW